MYIIFFVLELVLIHYLILNASKYLLVDIPNKRSSHSTPKPKGAGIAIFLTSYLYFLIVKNDFFMEYFFFFVSSAIVFAIGLYDDIKNIAPKFKFLAIWIAVILLFFTTDLKLLSLGIWFNHNLTLPTILALMLNLFVISGYTNALNLVDGLDGLAGSISLIIFATFLYLGIRFEDIFVINISLSFVVFIVAFLLFNWYPSKIFMGDSGSLLLGFVISIVAIKLTKHISITTVLFLAGLPVIDTMIVMIRRIKNGLSPFSADKSHSHHILQKRLNSIPKTVFAMSFIQIILSFVGILLLEQNNMLILLLFIAVTYNFYRILEQKNIHKNGDP